MQVYNLQSSNPSFAATLKTNIPISDKKNYEIIKRTADKIGNAVDSIYLTIPEGSSKKINVLGFIGRRSIVASTQLTKDFLDCMQEGLNKIVVKLGGKKYLSDFGKDCESSFTSQNLFEAIYKENGDLKTIIENNPKSKNKISQIEFRPDANEVRIRTEYNSVGKINRETFYHRGLGTIESTTERPVGGGQINTRYKFDGSTVCHYDRCDSNLMLLFSETKYFNHNLSRLSTRVIQEKNPESGLYTVTTLKYKANGKDLDYKKVEDLNHKGNTWRTTIYEADEETIRDQDINYFHARGMFKTR